jgi:hypothetical protein
VFCVDSDWFKYIKFNYKIYIMNNGTLIVFVLGWICLLAAWLIKGNTDKRLTIKLMLATASCAFFAANAIYTFVK